MQNCWGHANLGDSCRSDPLLHFHHLRFGNLMAARFGNTALVFAVGISRSGGHNPRRSGSGGGCGGISICAGNSRSSSVCRRNLNIRSNKRDTTTVALSIAPSEPDPLPNRPSLESPAAL